MSFSKNCRFVFSFVVSLAACSSSKGTGGARQACYANGTCNTGLICLSSVCVSPPDGGAGTTGTAGSGGAGAAAGASGSAGAAAGTSGGDAAAGTSGGDATAGASGGDAAAGTSGNDAAAGTSGTDAGTDAVVNCGLPSNWGTLTPASNIQFGSDLMPMFGNATIDQLDWQAYLPDARNSGDNNIIDVSLFSTLPPFGATITAMPSIDLSSQSDYATCGACVMTVVDADTNQAATKSLIELGPTYIATSGTLGLTTVAAFPAVSTSRVTGTLSNVVFTHVNIDPVTGATTSAGDGCKFTVTSVAFDAPVTNLP